MTRIEAWHFCTLLFPCLALLHLYVSPFTKVEESFNIQAAHDVLMYGVPTQNVELRFKAQYDHVKFPGAVPRTFIGALMLAGIARPILWLRDGLDQQIVVRGILGAFNALSLITYATGVRNAFGKSVAAWFVLFQASQFHVFYYASRTLPNMFAFGISTFALRFLLPQPGVNNMTRVKRIRLALYLLAIATVIFRAELGLLIAAHCLYILAEAATNDARWTLLTRTIVPAGLSGALVGLILTVSIDTFFWQSSTPIWPEMSAFLANVFPSDDSLGASAWGTSPWYCLHRHRPGSSTIISSIARPFYNLHSTVLDTTTQRNSLSLPLLPTLTTAMALAAHRLSINHHFRALHFRPLIILTTLATALLSHLFLLPLSSLNYPGAHALSSLHTLAHNTQPHITVHLDNLSLQTGITRFLQLPPPSSPLIVLPGRLAPGGAYTPEYDSGASMWVYDKTENATQLLSPKFWLGFDWCIMEEPGKAVGAWDVKDVVYGLGRPRIVRPGEELVVSDSRKTWSGLLSAMYGEGCLRAYEIAKSVLYERGLTRGWWVEWGLEPKLYILKKGSPLPRETLQGTL